MLQRLRSSFQRQFATQPQNRADKFKKEAPVKKLTNADRARLAERKTAWSLKNDSGAKEKPSWFPKLLLEQENKRTILNALKRSPSLWEHQVAQRYQQMISKRNNRYNFAIECALRIRDSAIAQLPPALQEDVMASGKMYHKVPLIRRCATWTPPTPGWRTKTKEVEE